MLKSLEIQNFRSCVKTHLQLNEPITALVGKNGVGKTNVLQAIEWLAKTVIRPEPVEVHSFYRERSPLCLSTLIKLDNSCYDYLLQYKQPDPFKNAKKDDRLQETLSVTENGGPKTVLFRRDGEKVLLGDRLTSIRVNRSTPAIGALSSLLPTSDSLQAHLQKLIDSISSVSYYPLVWPKDQSDIIDESQYAKWRAAYVSDGTIPDPVGFRLLYMWKEDNELLEEFQSIMGSEGLGLIDSFEVRGLREPHPGEAKESGETLFLLLFVPSRGVGGSGNPFYFRNLSAGTQRIISMIVSLLFDKRSLVLIEQPEDSIHPGLLRKLLDTIRSYSDRTQVVFSTHSPAVLDMLRPEEVQLVSSPEGQTQIRQLSADEVSSARQFLQDEGSFSDFCETLEEL